MSPPPKQWERRNEHPLSDEDHARIDRLLGAVIENPGMFDPFHVDFAMTNAERLGQYGRNTFWSPGQEKVLDQIEHRIEETGHAE